MTEEEKREGEEIEIPEYSKKRNFKQAQANGFSKGGSKKGHKKSRISAAKQTKILELKAAGLPVCAIARTVKHSHSAVTRLLDRYKGWMQNLEDVAHFKEHRADLVAAAQLTTLKTMMLPEKLEKASYNNLAYGLTQLHMFERLQREQSTANVSTKTQIFTGKADTDLGNIAD